jgi:hypothetical protein
MNWYMILVVAIPLSALAIRMAYLNWPRSAEAEFNRLYAAWSADAAERGLPPEQALAEYAFRMAWTRLRMRASEAAIKSPEHYQQKLAEIIKEEANGLAMHDRSIAKRFLNVAEGASHSEILFQDAMDVVMAQKTAVHVSVNPEMLAALRK